MAGGSNESYILANDVDATNHTAIENFKGTFNMSEYNIDNLRTCLFAKIINDPEFTTKPAINAGRFTNAKILHRGNQAYLGVIACETEGDIGFGDIDFDHCDVTAGGGNSQAAGLLSGHSFNGDIVGTDINAHDCTVTSNGDSGALIGFFINGLANFDQVHLKMLNVKSEHGRAGAIGKSNDKVVFFKSIIEESSFSSSLSDAAAGTGQAKEFHLINSTLKDNKISHDTTWDLVKPREYRVAAAVATSQKTVIKDSNIINNRISCTTKAPSLCTSAEICPTGTISKEGHNNYVCCNLLVSQGGRGSTTTHQNTRSDMNCTHYTNSSAICDFRSKPVTRSSPSTNTNTNANINATSPTDSNASTNSAHFSGSDTTNPMTMDAAPEWVGSAIGGTVVAGAALALTTGYVGRTFYNHWHGKTWSESTKEPFTTSYNAAKNCFTSCADWLSSNRNDEPSVKYDTLEERENET